MDDVSVEKDVNYSFSIILTATGAIKIYYTR